MNFYEVEDIINLDVLHFSVLSYIPCVYTALPISYSRLRDYYSSSRIAGLSVTAREGQPYSDITANHCHAYALSIIYTENRL